MTPGERVHYHKTLWPAACRVNGWPVSDAEKRREVVLVCMQQVRGPLVTTSDPRFGRDEVTALFCFLEHLAAPDELDKSLRWDTCRQDYRTYNRARQADWHERKLYGRVPNKLDRDRFAGATSASGKPIDDLDPEQVRKRHMTFARRHQKADPSIRRQKGQNLASQPVASTPPPGVQVNTPAPAVPAGQQGEGEPF
jgi:hypothetical protein